MGNFRKDGGESYSEWAYDMRSHIQRTSVGEADDESILHNSNTELSFILS
jgi:hypothetical protein